MKSISPTSNNHFPLAASFSLGLLDPAEHQAFLETLATSPAARTQLDLAEALNANIARCAPPLRPRLDVLQKALTRIQNGKSSAVTAENRVVSAEINASATRTLRTASRRSIGWATAAAVVIAGGYHLETQHQTIVQMEHKLDAVARLQTAFPPGKTIDPPTAIDEDNTDGATMANIAKAGINSERLAASGTERSVLIPVHELTILQAAAAKLHAQELALLPPAVSDGNKVESVFVELRGPQEKPNTNNTQQLSKLVEGYMTAAAKAIDAPKDTPKPALIGANADVGSFELYGGMWDMGGGILYNEDSGLLMVPRGDGRTYDYKKLGPGFDVKNLPATRQRLQEEAEQRVLAQNQPPEPTADQGLPRAYIYADRQSGEGFVVVKRLPALDDGEVYRLYQNTASPEFIGDLPPEELGSDEAVLKLPKPSAAGEGFMITRKALATPAEELGEVILRGK